nr:GNAT family N-acetyltransferase [Pediococcus argentinicus]
MRRIFVITIREANKDDAGQIAPLINIIYDEMELEELDDVPDPLWLKVLRQAYSTDEYLNTMARTVVAEDDQTHRVVGVAFGYSDEYEQSLDDILDQYAKQSNVFDGDPLDPDLEAYTDEWYLDSIAVDPNYQGQGIGGKLLKALPKFVRHDGETTIGLNVDFENPAAKKLYDRDHFITVGIRQIGDHLYFHMQKEVQVA